MSERQLKNYWTLSMQQKFLIRFSQLLSQGFSISAALEVMSTLFKPQIISVIATNCATGEAFANILEQCQFEKRIVYIVRCSEEAGSLLQGLKKAADYSDYQLKNKTELNKQLRYPCFLFLLMIAILAVVYLFFIPQLESFYESFNLEGDSSTLDLILTIIGTTLLIFSLIGTLTALIFKCPHAVFQKQCKNILFKCPLLNQLLQKVFSYYFSSQWLVFLNCGLALKQSLLMMQRFESIPLIKLIIHEFECQLESGVALEDVFYRSPYFTPYFKLITKHALQIGQVETELHHYSQNELLSISTLLTTTFKSIQFLFLLLIGLIIILIYLNLLQPVFQMAQLI